jgi:hypothetical protein
MPKREGEGSREDLLKRWAEEAERLRKGGEPNLGEPESLEIYYGTGDLSKVAYEDFQRGVQAAGRLKDKRSLFHEPVTVRGRLADYFVAKEIKDEALPFERKALPSNSTVAELAQKVAPEALRKELEGRLVTIVGGNLKETAVKLQMAHDAHPGKPAERPHHELLHNLHTLIALQNDPELQSRLQSNDAPEAIEALHELYTDRLRDSKIESLRHPDRMAALLKRHHARLEAAGVKRELPGSFEKLAELYEEAARPEEFLSRQQKEYQARLAEIKRNLSEAIQRANDKTLPPADQAHAQRQADELAGELKKFRAANDQRVMTLQAYKSSPHKPLFRELLEELHASNPHTQKATARVKALFEKVRVGKAGQEFELVLDTRPSIRDAFAGVWSDDCTKGEHDLFTGEHTHNAKAFRREPGSKELGEQVGNLYLLEGTLPDGRRALHLDALQLPVKADMRHLTREVVEKVWEAARKQGFQALTANRDIHRVSNQATVQAGFEANYKKAPDVKVTFPKDVHRRFHSLEASHRLLKEA